MIQSQLAPCQETEKVSISIEQRVIGSMRTILAATTARLSGGAIFGAGQERRDVGFQMQMQGLGCVLGGGKQAVWLSLESRRLGCQRIANHQNCLPSWVGWDDHVFKNKLGARGKPSSRWTKKLTY